MSTIAVNAITDANAGNTATINGVTPNSANVVGKNKIINGAMRIDQRNSGSAVTINTTSNTYTLDRWSSSGHISDGVFTIQRSTEAPAGFTNSSKITVTTADASIGSTQNYLFNQFIEGNNVADLGFGTANAKTITVSFWVRSSLTGTFGGALNNSANDRNYPFTYSISAADTWEYKTITIAGDTSGTWLTDTSRGIALRFQIGVGSDRIATAGSWTGTSSIFGAIGATNIIETLNATFYITGVQLEVGESATEFEHRPYTTELQLCQRYYFKPEGIYLNWCGFKYGTSVFASIPLPVTMRANPTFVQTTGANWYQGGGVYTYTPLNISGGVDYVQMNGTASGGLDGGAGTMYPNFTASAEL
jgi:hypothetical protein